MSMPIQRQSEQFAAFDNGVQWARERGSHELPKGLAALVNTSGPRITGGMLNTRTAAEDEADDEDEGIKDERPSSSLPPSASHYEVSRRSRGQHWPGHRSSSRTAGWHYPDEYDPRVDGWPEEDYRRIVPTRAEAEADEAEDDDYDDYDYSLEKHDPERFIPEDLIKREREARLRSLAAHLGAYEGGPASQGGRHPFDLVAKEASIRTAATCTECGKPCDWMWDEEPGSGARWPVSKCCDADITEDGPDEDRAYDTWKDDQLSGHDWREGALRPFDRGRREAKGKCECWDGYERVPGTKPCAEGSCRKCDSHRKAFRLAGWADDNPAFDDIMKHIDEQLAAGEQDNNRQVFRDPRFNGDNGHRPDRNQELAEQGFSTGPGDAYHVAWEGKACPDCAMALANGDDSGASEGWSWDAMQSGINSLPGTGEVFLTCGEDDDCDSHFQRGPCDLCGNPDSGTFHPIAALERGRRDQRHAAAPAPVADPAQMAMPAAGGLLPGHRVGLPWRDQVIRGTVIGLDGDNAAVRWDDGQYSSEEPRNIHLL